MSRSKKIFADFDDWWAHNKATGFSSASRDWAKKIWKELEPTIEGSRDDYKKAYAKLMRETMNNRSELVTALLDYIDAHRQEGQPNFWRWWLDQMEKKDNEAK